MLPSGLMTSSDSGIKLSIDQRFNTLLIRTLKQAFVRIITVAVLLVITGAIVRPFVRMFLAFHRTGSFHFPPAFLANSHMKITGRIGTVDHAIGFGATNITAGNDGWIDLVYIHRHPIVEYIAFPFKILSPCFDAISDDTAVKLVDIFKALFQQVR